MGARTHGSWWKWNCWSVRHTRLLTSPNRTWACLWYICKGYQESDQGLDKQETWEALAVHLWTKAGYGLSKRPPAKSAVELLNLSRNLLRIMTAANRTLSVDLNRAGRHSFGSIMMQAPGLHFLTTADFAYISISKVLSFVQSVGLLDA